MKVQQFAWLFTGLLVLQIGSAADGGASKVQSLRGPVDLAEVAPPDRLKNVPKRNNVIPPNYAQQPPLIPHDIRHYQIDKNVNKCLSCHSPKNYRQWGATKISVTHYLDRDGRALMDVSPRRYFCTQCHVPQTDAPPLVENTYQSQFDQN